MKKLPIVVLGIVAAAISLWFGKPLYQRLMGKRLLHAAQAAASRREYAEAGTLYSLAIQRDRDSLEILRSCAAFLNEQHNPQLLQIRERIHQLDPGNLDAFFDYVEAALMFQEPNLARGLLVRQAPTGASQSARFYHLLSVSHFLANELAQADAAGEEALKRDPGNKVFRVNQASIRLSCPDPAVRRAARKTLYEFYADRDEHKAALRELLVDAGHTSESEEEPGGLDGLLAEARKSILPQDAFFTDYLSALRRWRPIDFAPRMTEYLKAALAQENRFVFAQRWLAASGLYEEELSFRASLPPAAQSTPESLLLSAEAMFQLNEMARLTAFLREPAWGRYPALSLAFEERIRRNGGPADEDSSVGEAVWRKTLIAAGGAYEQLFILSRLASDWGWSQEYEATLWLLADKDPSGCKDALSQLSRHYLDTGNAGGLHRALKHRLALDPDDPVIINNFAYVSFLLGRESSNASKLVADLCVRHPESASFAATRAFGLFKSGDTAGALNVFKNFEPKLLMGTPQGITYGLVLAANSNPQAGDFLKNAERLTHFPEEQRLIAESRIKAGR